ncbi:MAG: biopolymer transporter ExbD, partial [Candidatus Latescibacterota bacterium]
IKLPEAEEAQAPEKENLFIVVDQDGNMKLNHQTVTFSNLKDKIQEKRQLLDNTTMIIIQGDERATHGQIVQIMDIARQVGVVDQIIATEPNRGR